MVDDPDSRLETSMGHVDDDGLSGLMVGLVGGTFMTIAYTFWGFLGSLGQTMMRPFEAFGTALAQLITGSIGGPVVMLEAAAMTGVESVTTGLFSTFGVFAYPVTMFSVVAGLYIFSRGWETIDLSPWNFLRNLRR